MPVPPPPRFAMSPPVANLFRSERLIYRDVEDKPESIDWIWDTFRDPETAAMGWNYPGPPSRDTVEGYFRHQMADKYLFVFCYVLADEGVTLASGPAHEEGNPPAWDPTLNLTRVGLVLISREGEPHNRVAIMGRLFSQENQGKGYGTEAGRWALGWAFKSADLYAVRTDVSTANAISRASNRNMGMTEVGRLPGWMRTNGRRYDCIMYYAQADAWLAAEERRLAGVKVDKTAE